jgi:hypothetical protein
MLSAVHGTTLTISLMQQRWSGISDVPSQAQRARQYLLPRTGVKLGYAVDRAEERTEPEDVGEQALIRGLATAFPFFVWGCPGLGVGCRSTIGHIDTQALTQDAELL